MIKGCHKRIVFLKDTGNELFDEAYFILKPQAFNKKESDVVLEASKIVNGLNEQSIKPRERKKALGRILIFSVGAIVGAIATALIQLMVN